MYCPTVFKQVGNCNPPYDLPVRIANLGILCHFEFHMKLRIAVWRYSSWVGGNLTGSV